MSVSNAEAKGTCSKKTINMLIENYVALSAKDYQEEVNQDIRLNFKKHKYVRIKRNEKGEVVYSNGLKINSVNLESVFNRDM